MESDELPTAGILIVDDEAPARLRLRQLLDDIAADFPHRVAGEAQDAASTLRLFGENEPGSPIDVVLLDVQMPGMNGIQLARHLGASPHPPAIVFVTAFDEYAVKAFEVHALDYLMKPVRAQRLLDALRRAVPRQSPARSPQSSLHSSAHSGSHFPTQSSDAADLHAVETRTQQAAIAALVRERGPREQIAVHERGRLRLVSVAEIVYLKAEQKYVTVRTAAREFLIEESLVALEDEFARTFVRVHRNALVARNAIVAFERVDAPAGDAATEPHWQVELRGIAESLPVSRRQWPVVKSLVKALVKPAK